MNDLPQNYSSVLLKNGFGPGSFINCATLLIDRFNK